MTRTRTHKLHEDESRWFFAALSVLLVSFIAYGYFVSAAVVHVVVRKDVDRAIADQSSLLSELEAEYIASQHAVSADIASLKGFTHNPKKIFIDTSGDVLVLSRN